MLQAIKDLQNTAVTKLVNLLSENKKELTFKAPTGSGKTHMMADFMNRVIAEDPEAVFIVSTLSKSNLAEQNFDKFKDYVNQGKFPDIRPFLIQSDCSGEGSLYIPPTYNVYVLPRDLYKDKAKLKKEGTFLKFLYTMQGDLLNNQKSKKIYLIKDECHIATNNLDELKEYFPKIINFSATPKLSRKQHPDVEITTEEAQNVNLIKRIEKGSEEDGLEEALKKFDAIKADYTNKLEVSPCMIIQISNKEKAEKELEEVIKPALNKHSLKWVYITGDDKTCATNDNGLKKLPVSKWKEYMKYKISSISVIIFKMVISEGWDIPRACMLYQIRDSKSRQLDEQVMGRVRRNPRLLDFETLSEEAKKLACTAWIWGILPPEESKVRHVKLFPSLDIHHKVQVTPTKLQRITASKSVVLEKYIKNAEHKQKKAITHPSIFEMYKNLMRQNNDIQTMCYSYAKSFDQWRVFVENLSEIKTFYDDSMGNYEENMVACQPVSFPLESCYNESEASLTLEDWVWCRENVNDFSFDSEAEKKWAELLKDIRSSSIDEITYNDTNKFLWGKNYPFNSEIKYEYYLNGAVHVSYPDFVMKDKRGQIHIFEVKSVNKSLTKNIDTEEYADKVQALKKCYRASSQKTPHIFYLPILEGSKWQITKYENGYEQQIDEQSFKQSVKS